MSTLDRRMIALWAEVDDNINRFGWHCMSVFPTDDDEGEWFSYTVGLAEKGHPELIVFGLSPEVGYGLLALLYERSTLEKERLRAGPVVGIAEGFTCWLVECDDDQARQRLTWAYERARGQAEGMRAMQLVWPDKGGRLPWDDGYDVPARLQPVIGATP